jgi:hypothetical protein
MQKELEKRLMRMATCLQKKRAATKRAKQKAPKQSNSTPAIMGAMKMRDACAYLGGIPPSHFAQTDRSRADQAEQGVSPLTVPGR